MDEARAEALYERILTEMTGGMELLTVYLGHRLGLFKELANNGTVTVAQLTKQTQLSERYVREWLLAVATSGYVEADAYGERFTLPEEHVAVLADEDSPFFIGAYPGILQGLAMAVEPLLEAFKSGGGVPYEDYGGHFREGVALTTRPMYQHEYAQKWIPTMPEVEAKLNQGARVADIGCGVGWSCIFLAKHFKKAKIDGFDLDEESIAEARYLADQYGVSDRVHFHVCAIEEFKVTAPYDLVTALECLHDMPYPVKALSRMREMASPGGNVFIADDAGGESFSDNINQPLGSYRYNVSVLHCLPQAMVFPDAVGTGTAISESTVRKYAHEAGFSYVKVIAIENLWFRFYQLTP
jgi:2-polyprenyl-3-methyl-5-hydroxy-6-metoxy-1,4-benzoquinol methylase